MIPMILPKGIVVNSSDIYAEVASYPTVPPEKIGEYWHVYTTTFRKLIDPTAHRLENFWWHVWGSDRRFLSGAVLARIFEDISKGPTVVEIVGPPNRFEGQVERRVPSRSQTLPINTQDSPGSSKGQRDGCYGDATHVANPPLKPLSSSSSKPPPPHPILKKTRGPSSSGPRPTARFISPHESAEEDEVDTNNPSVETIAGAVEVRQPVRSPSTSKSEKKKGTPTGIKKQIAVSSASKRRPQLARRTGSQSSGGSAEGNNTIRSGSSGSGSCKYLGSQRSNITPIAEVPSGTITPKENMTDAEGVKKLSARAAGKQPAVPRAMPDQQPTPQPMTTRQQTSPNLQYHRPITSRSRGHVPSAQPSSLDLKRQTRPPGFEAVIARNQSARDLSRRGFDSFQGPVGAEPMVRSKSDMESRDHGGGTTGRHPVKGLISSTTAKTSSVAAQGIFEFDQKSVQHPVEAREEGDDKQADFPRPRRTSSVLDSRLIPTAPNPAPDVELGRTKSQLTLLLEREKSRLGQN
ncbi:hypothetical protein MKZ38_006723 [Zalerion maritima]|uniref:Nitrogen regulatory protein areA GATA-like domain-containing protein n=1 Tax=Zalerion maritima TaxID=339359 RepID=A0AAD5WPI8_9PEZI|nr:hypothetical protein MKZ38_006723 [Zalerion maritima]